MRDPNVDSNPESNPSVVVLKLGGSVLTGGAAIFRVAREVMREVRLGSKVVAVVSAEWGATDELVRRARRLTADDETPAYAALLATGEARSAACLTLALEACGVSAELLEAHRLELRTSGSRIEAEPQSVGPELRRVLAVRSVVVAPGFVGIEEDGSTTLLGRGGTDLTAVFLAHHLGAHPLGAHHTHVHCRLLKDVEGWFTDDPASRPDARRYRDLHWDDAIRSQAPIVQPRAVRLARRLGQPFEVTALGSVGASRGTRVGPWPTWIEDEERGLPKSSPIPAHPSALPLSRDTLLVHPPSVPGEPSGSSSTPIYQTATFALGSDPAEAAWDYSRSGNPTRDVLEAQLAALDGGGAEDPTVRALAYSSGVAALTGVLRQVPRGGEVVAGEDLYGGTQRLLARLGEHLGVRVVAVDTTDPDRVAAAVSDATDLVLIESPSNPRLRVTSIPVVAEIAHRHGARLAVDNSLLSSYLIQPLALGADVAIQSATKLLGGHADLTAGVVAVVNPELGERLAFDRNAEGTALAPFEAWLLLRGLSTLAVRLDRQLETARRIVAFLRAHPGVTRVWYPKHGPGGVVISFETGSREISRKVVRATRLFAVTVSFGSVRSSISLPAEMSHACVPEDERHRHGLAEDLVRLSVGLEAAEELIEDLGRTLELAASSSSPARSRIRRMPRIQAVSTSIVSFVVLLAILGWALVPGGSALAQTEDFALFQPLDVFELEWASDPQISPDGSRIVYVRNFMDVMTDRRRSNLWIVSADGSDHRPLTHGGGDRSPRWSPDGSKILYVSSEGGSSQLWLHWLDSGRGAPITRLTKGPSGLTWSPDGLWIAFSMPVPYRPEPFAPLPPKPEGAEWAPPPKVIDKVLYRIDGGGYLPDTFTHLFVVPAEGGTPRQVTSGDYQHGGAVSWTPDGKFLIFSANREEDRDLDVQDSEVQELEIATGAIRPLTDRQGPDNSPVVSPDGSRIAYLGYDDREQGYQVTHLYVMDRDGGNPRQLTGDFDRSVSNPTWSKDGKSLYVRYTDRGDGKVARVSLDGVNRKVETLASHVDGLSLGRPYGGGDYSVADDGRIAFTLAGPYHPADVAVTRGNGEPRRLTELNRDLFEHKRLGEVEEIVYRSSHDGREIQGWIVKPPGFDPERGENGEKYPLILEIHGGPFADYGPRFAAEIQLYAAAGYVVLYTNPRGSSSYGAEFGNLIHHAYPGNDYHDLMSGVDAVLAKGYVDPEQLFVTGGSGGGVLSAWIVGNTDRFAAAVVAKPVINWLSFVGTADFYPFFSKDYWFPGLPWENPMHFWERSPLSKVGNVKTPTMLLTGEADYRTPIAESEQFYQALQLRGIDTALVRIPEASHSIADRPSQLIAKVLHILAWFERYRTPGEESADSPRKSQSPGRR